MEFCTQDLAREDNIRAGPKFWGPAIWRVIHVMSLWAGDPHAQNAEPISAPKQFRAFMHALVPLLPCSICSDHLRENLETLPIHESRISSTSFNSLELFRWSYDLHSLVNKLGKKPNLPYSVLIQRSQVMRSPECWGPAAWRMLHSIASAYTYSQVESKAFRALIQIWVSLIPPQQGGIFLKAYLRVNPLSAEHLRDSNNLFKWTYDLHNAVNQRLGKPNLSFTKAKSIYMM